MLNGGVRIRRSAGIAVPTGMPISSIAKPGAATVAVRVAHATITDATPRIDMTRCPTRRRFQRVTRAMPTADASVTTTRRTVVSDAGVPSRAYFTEVR